MENNGSQMAILIDQIRLWLWKKIWPTIESELK